MRYGKLFLALMLAAAVSACDESSSPSSKQEAAPTVEKMAEPKTWDDVIARRLPRLQKQADSGDADAQLNLGLMYANGKGVPKDVAKAVEWYQKAAAQGNAKAQFNLGVAYANGAGVPKDVAKAMEWYQKAAARGHARAQRILWLMYRSGIGVPKDDAKAVEWLQKEAAQGGANAQAVLGTVYRTGEGVPKDYAKAVEWYQKAAAQGDVYAQIQLGGMYRTGEGVTKDAAKAVEWYQKAATQGYVEAQYDLGGIYLSGEGVPKDYAKVAEWWQKAAAQGHAEAQFSLGMMYAEGDGVPKDSVLAYAWTNLAAAQGGVYNKKAHRDALTLSSAQRAEAERLSSNWKMGQVLRREGESVADADSTESAGGAPAKQGTGTAFVVSTEGHAVTNHHVVVGCKEVRVQGRSELVQVITRDEVSDLALLKMPGETRAAAALSPDPASLRQGQDIMVFGFPLDSVLSSGGNLTPGVVSAITGLGNNSNQIQITAPIQPGSSGSPVMDKKGHVVGVVSMKLSDSAMVKHTGTLAQNVNFAISGQTLKAFLDANRVPYKTGRSFFAWEKSLADLGDEARKWTTVVECWE